MAVTSRPKIHQIDGLQILRAVAVILVAWLHAGQQFGMDPLPIDFGVFGIDIFFVISGFILSLLVLRERRLPGIGLTRTFLIRRAIRIFPLYWIFSAVIALRMLVSHVHIARDFAWCVLLLPVESRIFVPVGWTLRFEVLFYVLMGAVICFTTRRALPVLVGLLGLLAGIGVVFDLHRSAWVVVCNPILLEFVFGIVVAMVYARFGVRRRAGRAMLLVGSLLATYLATQALPGVAQSAQMVMVDAGVLPRVLTWGVAAVLIVGGMVFWSPGTDGRLSRLMVAAGSASYSAYLVSGFVVEFVVRLLNRVIGVPQRPWPGVFFDQCVVTLAVLAAGGVSYAWLEKPMLDWMHRKMR